VSRENFYAADTVTVSASRDLNRANTTIAGGYSLSFNRPELHPFQDVAHQTSQDVFASLTETLSKTTIVQFTYDYNRVSGYRSNPFLPTMVNGNMELGVAPDLRNRHAFAVRLRQALPADTYLEADYRHYFDDWSLKSNSLSVGLSHVFTPTFTAGFTYRWYDQTGTSFYQPYYVGDPTFYTGDFKLAPFNSGLYSGRVVITPHRGPFELPDGTSAELSYDRYLASTAFQAAIFSTWAGSRKALRLNWRRAPRGRTGWAAWSTPAATSTFSACRRASASGPSASRTPTGPARCSAPWTSQKGRSRARPATRVS